MDQKVEGGRFVQSLDSKKVDEDSDEGVRNGTRASGDLYEESEPIHGSVMNQEIGFDKESVTEV